MKPVPSRRRFVAGEWVVDYHWKNAPGVVYLMRCKLTGDYKIGATIDPSVRLPQLASTARTRYGRELVYVWYIVTNGVGRLEACWKKQWERFRISGMGREWLRLPNEEVRRFISFVSVIWNDIEPIPPDVLDAISRPEPHEVVFGPGRGTVASRRIARGSWQVARLDKGTGTEPPKKPGRPPKVKPEPPPDAAQPAKRKGKKKLPPLPLPWQIPPGEKSE